MSSERGAVTAEFMLLLPGLVLLAGIALGGFNLALERISLEVEAFQAARHYSITGNLDGHELTEDGRFSCVKVVKQAVLPLSAESCLIRYGG